MCDKLNLAAPAAIFLVFIGPKHPKMVPKRSFLLHYQKIFDLIIGQDDEDIKKEIERRMAAMSEEEKNSMSEGELYRKLYMEVWDGSGIEGWYD